MTKQARILTDKQFELAYKAAQDWRERSLLCLSVKAGLRAKEIAGLTWEAIDFDQGVLRLSVTKGDKFREVPMHKLLSEVLFEMKVRNGTSARPGGLRDDRALAEGTHFIFGNTHNAPGRPVSPNAVNKWFSYFYRERMGWEGYSSHSGRRTFVTKAARKITEAGGSLKDVQALAGHADLKTTSRYIEVDPEAQRKVVSML